jgi:predicted enzyme related to lactoylglutathione lyase
MADKLLGSFVWCELLTTDTAAAQSFYKKVVGWTAVPFAPDGPTRLEQCLGRGVGGVMKLPDAAKQMGAPPNWMMYVGTPSVDDTAVRIVHSAGACSGSRRIFPTGRFAVVQDPFGAAFGIFQPPAEQTREIRSAGCRRLLLVRALHANPEGAWKFYERCFGWEKTSAMDMGEMGVYQMFGRGGGIPTAAS